MASSLAVTLPHHSFVLSFFSLRLVCDSFSVVLFVVGHPKQACTPSSPPTFSVESGEGYVFCVLFRSFDFLRHYRLSTPGYESKLPWARTGTVPRRLTLGVTLNHKSNLVPSGSIGPPHHMSVGLYEAMGMSTFFSLLRDVETNNRQKYITPSLTASILPGYCDCAG